MESFRTQAAPIHGLELQVNHAFNNGFGVSGNYTFTDGTAPGSSYLDGLNLHQASKHNMNSVGYYARTSAAGGCSRARVGRRRICRLC